MTLNRGQDYFFSHGTADTTPGELPHCPCEHEHAKIQAAEKCGRKRGSTHVRRVRKGKGIRDTRILGRMKR